MVEGICVIDLEGEGKEEGGFCNDKVYVYWYYDFLNKIVNYFIV